MRKRSPYLGTPIAIGRLSKVIRLPNLDLPAVLNAKINVFVKDGIADGVKAPGGKADCERRVVGTAPR